MNKLCLIIVYCWASVSKDTLEALYNIDDRYLIADQVAGCVVINISMTCREIPRTIPDKIRNVTVTNHNGTLEYAFTGSGWEHVVKLHISGTTSRINYNELQGLEYISEFSMNFPNLIALEIETFLDTPRIEKLFFLKMNRLYTVFVLQSVTFSGALYNLTELRIESGDEQDPPQFEIVQWIVNHLLLKPLTNLCITKSILQVEIESLMELLLKLDVFNVSDSSFQIPLLPIVDHSEDVPLLLTLDISGTTFPYSSISSQGNQTMSQFTQNIFFRTENVYVNRHFKSDCSFVLPNSPLNARVFLKSFTAKQNNIRAIYGHFFPNANNSFEMLDLSQNKIGYISPDSISSAVHLKTLILSYNRLWEMQMMTEFSKLIFPFQNLSTLLIDNNNISYIPWNMFIHNEKLEAINIAGNKLKTVGFKLGSLKVLKTLDLSRNDIHFVEGGNLKELVAFEQVRMKHCHFQILMQENPFVCVCESVPFIQWLFTVQSNDKSHIYTCEYEGSIINIDKTAIKKSRFLCKRTLIIITSSILSLALIGFVCGSFIGVRRCRRRHVTNYRKTKFKQKFADGRLPHDYICFMAFASYDEDVVLNSLLTPLTAILKEKLNTSKEVMATGDNFRPGQPIYAESFDFVKISSVFVAVISNKFCESDYCKAEILDACTQQKPIIVVILETVAEDKMPPYLLEVFLRKARAKLTRCVNGDIRLVPDIDTLAECVLALAINGNEVINTPVNTMSA